MNDTPAFVAVRDQLDVALRQLPYEFKPMPTGGLVTQARGIPVLYRVLPDDNGRPLVLIEAFVLADVEFTVELLAWIANQGQWNLRFTAAAMMSDDDYGVVVFRQSMDVTGVSGTTMFEFTEAMLDRAEAEMDHLQELCDGTPMTVWKPEGR